MRPPPIVSNPFPPKTVVHRCHKHGCRMVDRPEGGICCPICTASKEVWVVAPPLEDLA